MIFDDKEWLSERVKELEIKLAHLRANRRVLLFLVEKIEKEKKQEVLRLEKENKLLQSKNARLARLICTKERDLVIVQGNQRDRF